MLSFCKLIVGFIWNSDHAKTNYQYKQMHQMQSISTIFNIHRYYQFFIKLLILTKKVFTVVAYKWHDLGIVIKIQSEKKKNTISRKLNGTLCNGSTTLQHLLLSKYKYSAIKVNRISMYMCNPYKLVQFQFKIGNVT